MKLHFTLKGQVRGGKNNMGVTRTGIHYPKPEFVAWRNAAVRELTDQWIVQGRHVFDKPCAMSIAYHPGDKRRRDVPAILDAIFHVLERTAIVDDDCLIKDVDFQTLAVSKNPGVEFSLEEIIDW